jgi:hypothetical protein
MFLSFVLDEALLFNGMLPGAEGGVDIHARQYATTSGLGALAVQLYDDQLWPDTNQMWERACSRRGRISQHFSQLIHRFREQARSHNFVRVLPIHLMFRSIEAQHFHRQRRRRQ